MAERSTLAVMFSSYRPSSSFLGAWESSGAAMVASSLAEVLRLEKLVCLLPVGLWLWLSESGSASLRMEEEGDESCILGR